MKHRAVLTFFLFLGVILSTPVLLLGAEDGAAATAAEEADARQLRIYREALLQGSTEEIRSDAAVGLLLRTDEASRQFLVDVLKSFDNPLAQRAVCKALISSRGLGGSTGSREVYREPLGVILQDGDKDQAALAAEAMLIYDYKDIADTLSKVVADTNPAQQGRMNGIYALKIRPEPAALRSLIGLLGDSDPEVVQAAEDALQQAFGIPVGTSRVVWADILKELQQKSPDDIRRERLLRQEMKLRQIQADRDRWQKLYLSSLDKQYEVLDEAGRSAMILETLASELGPVRVWALGKTVQFQAAGNELISSKLFGLLADEDRDVRLQAAKVLNNMSALNPAEALLAQFKVEKDPEVALAIFEALGEACFYAFSPGSNIVLSADIKTQTLDIAAQYLNQDLPERSRKGAEVIRKILELNNLSKDSVQAYLELLFQRYEQASAKNAALQADLLGVMAHLCGQGSQKPQACILYEPSFVQGLSVADNPALRLSAVRGLIAVDKVKALELFKEQQLNRDKSLAVRQIVVDLAGETGNSDDLGWLLVMLNENGHSEEVFDAIKRICERQTAEFVMNWLTTLETAGARSEYIHEILRLAEKKAAGENNSAMLKAAQTRSIQLYAVRKEWENAAGYLKGIGYLGDIGQFDSAVNVLILKVYLKSGMYEEASRLIGKRLVGGDLAPATAWIVELNGFFNDDNVGNDDKTAFYMLISSIKAENRPLWGAFVSGVGQILNPVEAAVEGVAVDEAGVTEP